MKVYLLLSVRTLQCVSSGFSFYIRLTLDALRLQHLSSSHIFPVSHCLCLLLILSPFHAQTACDCSSGLLCRYSDSSLYLQPVRLVEVFGKFFCCCPFFHQILGSFEVHRPACRRKGGVVGPWICGGENTSVQHSWYLFIQNPDLSCYTEQKQEEYVAAYCCSAVEWLCLPLILKELFFFLFSLNKMH